MDNTIENFRKQLISENPDAPRLSVDLLAQVEDAFKALDVLTDTMADHMNATNCPDCSAHRGVMFGQALGALNSIENIRYELTSPQEDCG